MIKYYFKVALRSFSKDKNTFLINLLGLAGGLVSVLLIYFWVNSELQVDRFHAKADRLYQLIVHYHSPEEIGTGNSTPSQLAETFAQEMPEIENSVAVRRINEVTLAVGEKHLKANGKHASADFFEAFSYEFLAGDQATVLSDNNNIAISDRLALKLFNTTESLLGKSIKFQQDQNFQIAGVFKAPPENATLQFDFILPFEVFKATNSWALNWNYSTVDTYVSLREETDLNTFNQKIAGFLDTKRENQLPTVLEAVSYPDLYLHGTYENGVSVGGRIEYIRLFSIIAFFILLIACVNFMNLSTAKASRRMKEIGVKKVIGAKRQTLIIQFLLESCTLAILALTLALGIVWMVLPAFSQLAGTKISPVLDTTLGLSIIGITLFAGLLAGSYPALYLSGFQPSRIFKSQLLRNTNENWVRQGLVVLQFTISIVLIIAVLIVNQQINFVQTQNLGYNKENILHFGLEGQAKDKLETFLSEVNQLPSIEKASSLGQNVVGGSNRFTIQKWQGEENNQVSFEMRAVHYDLLETLEIEVLDGRSFTKAFNNEDNKVIFNEAAIEFMGLENPIGQKVVIDNSELEIIGVAKNFHFASLRDRIEPLFFVFRPAWTHRLMARVSAGKEQDAIAELQALYTNFNPGFPLEYEFLDQDYQAQYVAEQRVAGLSKYFALLTILLSCLGLFGLAIFNSELRVKEIGVRKVLGASVGSIVQLLSADFLKLVLIACLFAVPIAWYFLQEWLNGFAYHVDLQWWIFALAGIIAVGIALLTVSFQSVKAALANPVHSLRNE